MKVVDKETGKFYEAVIEIVKDEDWEIIDRSGQFEFNWREEKAYLIHKLRLKFEDEILGIISIEDLPKEFRLHIRLIENSKAHRGKNKKFDNITGCLIAHTCELAFEKEYDGFVSLKPKTVLVKLYKEKYGFREMGLFLFTEMNNSEALIKNYLGYDKKRRGI